MSRGLKSKCNDLNSLHKTGNYFMAICASGEKLLQEATGIRRGPVYPVAQNRKCKCVCACVSVCFLLPMHGHSFDRISTKFGVWHPSTYRWSWGIVSAALARGLAFRAPSIHRCKWWRAVRKYSDPSAVGAMCDRAP